MTRPPQEHSVCDRTVELTSASLLERAKGKDPAAWRQLVAIYGPLICRWCRQKDLSWQDTEDLVQDVFRGVAEHLADFRRDPSNGSFRGWLWTITNNKIRDYRRRLGRRLVSDPGAAVEQLEDDRASEGATESAPSQDELIDLVHRSMQLVRTEFEQRTWQAFWSTTVEDRHPQHVAEELGMSLVSVYQAKSRVLSRLRRELAGVSL